LIGRHAGADTASGTPGCSKAAWLSARIADVDAARGSDRFKAAHPPVERVRLHPIERLVGARHAVFALFG
jgi:hypothetical protein